MLPRIGYTLCLGLCPFSILADNVWLNNGDVLSGKIIQLNHERLVLETDYAGQLNLSRTQIKSYAINRQHRTTLPQFVPQSITYQLAEDGDADTVLNPTTQSEASKPNGIWHGGVKALTFYSKSHHSNQQYLFDGSLNAQYGDWTHRVGGALQRAVSDNETDSYFYKLGYDIDRYLNPKFYWTASAQFKHDWVEDVKSKLTVGSGPGFQLWETETSALAISALLNYQHLEYRNEETLSDPLAAVHWDYQYFFSGKQVEFFTNGYIGRSLDDAVDVDLSARAGLTYQLADWLSLNATITRDYLKTKNGTADNTAYGIGVAMNW